MGLLLYQYVTGNSLKYWDPFGLLREWAGRFFDRVGSNLQAAKEGFVDTAVNVAVGAAYGAGLIDSDALAKHAPGIMALGAGIENSGGAGSGCKLRDATTCD